MAFGAGKNHIDYTKPPCHIGVIRTVTGDGQKARPAKKYGASLWCADPQNNSFCMNWELRF